MKNIKYSFPKKQKKIFRRFCKILSSELYVPIRIIDNNEIIKSFDMPFNSSAILKSIGVEKRHVAHINQVDSDILCLSAKTCLDNYGLSPDCLSRIIVNKYFGDNLLPMTASRLLSKLGTNKGIQSFDVDGGVSSFIYGVDIASRYINSGDQYILISSGGVHRRLINSKDPRLAFLFGDGSASLLIGVSDEIHILSSYFYSNYNYYNMAYSISPLTIGDKLKSEKNKSLKELLFDTYIIENWREVENFYVEATKHVAKNLLEESNISMKNIDLVLVTENNRKIWELTLDVLKVKEENSISLIKEMGNTMAAMIPMQIAHGFKTGRIKEGMNIMVISHGEGFSGGGFIYKV